ncbi:Cupredoxin [Lipomyces starkeyi]
MTTKTAVMSFCRLLMGLALVFPSIVNGYKLRYHDQSFTPDVVLRVTESSISRACSTRYSVVINGTAPGPEIRLRQARTYWIRVYNDMETQNLTMHWHGLSMAASPFSDGSPQASQWPIAPQYFFDYELHPNVGDAGTYFYHSHIGFQAMSASGPLIIEDDIPPYQYDGERTVHLSDLFLKTDEEIETGLTTPPFVWSGETNNVLVNGQGLPLNTGVSDGDNECSLATILVEPEKMYRLRFIGATALSFVSLGFQGHNNLSIIEVDGDYTQPLEVDYLQIGAGQRFSVLMRTKSREELEEDRANGINQYFLQIETRERPISVTSYAVLIYPGGSYNVSTAPANPPITLPSTTLGWLDYQLRPLTPNNFPTLAEVTRRVTVTITQIVNNTLVTFLQNGFPWTESFPPMPYLVALYNEELSLFPSYESAVNNGGMDNKTRTFPAKLGEVLEIVIQMTGEGNGILNVHPFHAHGEHFYDIGSGNGTYDLVQNEERLKGTEPVRRDTTMMYRYARSGIAGAPSGWRAWRLRVTNAGVWLAHCHILQHMMMGMQTVWVFGDRNDVLRLGYPAVKGYLSYGGEAYGNSSRWPTCVHYWDDDDD